MSRHDNPFLLFDGPDPFAADCDPFRILDVPADAFPDELLARRDAVGTFEATRAEEALHDPVLRLVLELMHRRTDDEESPP